MFKLIDNKNDFQSLYIQEAPVKQAKIISTGKYIPEKTLTNEDLEKLVDTSDEWIYSRTGIKERHIALEDNFEMAAKAAQDALSGTSISPEEIDMIVVATMSSEYSCPSTACLVQDRIGAVNAFCYDLNAACSGFMFALETVTQYIQTGKVKNALVIGSEKLSQVTNWEDRNTCVLFGDGAGAVVVTGSDEAGIVGTVSHSIGSKYQCLLSEITHKKNDFYEQKTQNYISMDGREVFEFACTSVPASIREVLEMTDTDIEDVDVFVLHQANIRIIKRIAKVLKQDMSKFYANMNLYGNTSAASIPIALDDVFKAGDLTGKRVVMAGFGGGLTYGASVIQF